MSVAADTENKERYITPHEAIDLRNKCKFSLRRERQGPDKHHPYVGLKMFEPKSKIGQNLIVLGEPLELRVRLVLPVSSYGYSS